MRTDRLGATRLKELAWLVPALAGATVTGYLCWGAWVTAHRPRYLRLSRVWWRTDLLPAHDWTLVTVLALWLATWLAYWWPRERRSLAIGPVTIVAMVVVGAALGFSALVPCRGGQTTIASVGQVLGLYVGNSPSDYPTAACPGQPPLALQLGQVFCLGATLIGALAVAAVLWRKPLALLRARFIGSTTIVTGLDTLTIALVQRLVKNGRPGSIFVVEPDPAHPLLEQIRAAGARIIVGDPASARILRPIAAGWRGSSLSQLFALNADVGANEAILAATAGVLARRPDVGRRPYLFTRIDDPRHADHWRGWHIGMSTAWFADVVCPYEITAVELADRVFRTDARQLLLCGDSSFALAILLELGRRAREHLELAAAAAGHQPAESDGVPPFPLDRIVVVDQHADDLLREYAATVRPGIERLAVIARPGAWTEQLLPVLDAMSPEEVAGTAIAVVGRGGDDTVHESGRVARLYPTVPVFVLVADRGGTDNPGYGLLHPFRRTLLVGGEIPEDTLTRLARHWHECYRLSHPQPPGEPPSPTRRPWAELDEFIREDNSLQLRSIMTAVYDLGRRWVPAQSVPPGSFIELSDRELAEVAEAEHTRWYQRRLAAGWAADAGDLARPGPLRRRINLRVVPWAELPDDDRRDQIGYLRSQLAQLEGIGFMPIVPAGGPPQAGPSERVGIVQARKLRTRRTWSRRNGDELAGNPGDWQVLDDWGDEHTVRDTEFRHTYEHVDGERWRRTGTLLAWQVSEPLVLHTLEGRAVAEPGDWVVEGHSGERWPVANEQFRRNYRPASR